MRCIVNVECHYYCRTSHFVFVWSLTWASCKVEVTLNRNQTTWPSLHTSQLKCNELTVTTNRTRIRLQNAVAVARPTAVCHWNWWVQPLVSVCLLSPWTALQWVAVLRDGEAVLWRTFFCYRGMTRHQSSRDNAHFVFLSGNFINTATFFNNNLDGRSGRVVLECSDARITSSNPCRGSVSVVLCVYMGRATGKVPTWGC
jgi:hypothetical protein